MAIDVSLYVAPPPAVPGPLSITFPGGAVLAAQLPRPTHSASELAKDLLSRANAALAPLVPVFKIIDAVLSVIEAVKAVPGIVTDPAGLIEKVADMVRKSAALAALIPPLSIPLLVAGLLDALIAYLEGTLADVAALVEAMDRVDGARAQVERYPALAIVVTAADGQIGAHFQALSDGMTPIDTLMRLVSTIGSLAGLSAIPGLGSLGPDARAATTPIRDALVALRAIRATIPF